ncbi:MAG: acetate--CoA ligase family protein [Euryarchaeota archaeon]|jgi:succinyl-CoA synthetase beta subunit|nr:acetate--CoA ligase family protein [Euryarchaeota archaeon]
MKLYEYEAKKVFEKMGIPIPKQYGVIRSLKELDTLKLGFPLMLKSMVLVGGRGKAGGIKKANNLEEARKIAAVLFKLKIKGFSVDCILLEEAVEEIGACYVGITMDPATFNNVVIVSASGGVDIEQVAQNNPEAIMRKEIADNSKELSKTVAQDLALSLNQSLKGKNETTKTLAEIIAKVYATYQRFDARLCEINPLIMTSKGAVAADAKLVLDDNALFRQVELLDLLGITEKRHDVAERTKNELRAQSAGFPYIDLLPQPVTKDQKKLYVGLIPGGAGYGIFSIDEVSTIGNRYFHDRVIPVNFMDSGGGPPQNRVAEMFHLLMDYPVVDLIVTSRFGGISSCDIFIRGMVQAVKERYETGKRMVPVFGRMVGTDLPSARTFLEKAKAENPEALQNVTIYVGNQRIMADVIREGIQKAFETKGWKI